MQVKGAFSLSCENRESLNGSFFSAHCKLCLPPLSLSQCVLDGDLCEQFNSADPAKKRSIAEDLDRTPNEVSATLTTFDL